MRLPARDRAGNPTPPLVPKMSTFHFVSPELVKRAQDLVAKSNARRRGVEKALQEWVALIESHQSAVTQAEADGLSPETAGQPDQHDEVLQVLGKLRHQQHIAVDAEPEQDRQ
jgi:hypothetical protein